MRGASVGKIVAIDRGDDHMLQSQLGRRFGDLDRFIGVERAGQAGAHVTESACARAGIAHDHEGRVLLRPALANVGTARFLANGHEFVLAHDALRLGPFGGAGSLYADPRRLAQYWRVGAVCIFRDRLEIFSYSGELRQFDF